MLMKACSNSKCPAYAHFVYTLAMRCVLCRCDLVSAQRISEAAGDGLNRKIANEIAAVGRSGHAHARR
jgi:hypothetical protein